MSASSLQWDAAAPVLSDAHRNPVMSAEELFLTVLRSGGQEARVGTTAR